MSNNSPVPIDPFGGPAELAGQAQPGYPAANAGAGLPPGGPTTSVVKRTLLAMLRFKWMVLAIAVLGVGAAFASTRFQNPMYETRAQVWIGAGLSGGSGSVGPIRQGALLDAQGWQGLLKSSAVLDSVVFQRRLFLNLAVPGDSLLFEGFRLEPGLRFRPGSYSLATDENDRGFVLIDGEGSVIQRGAFGDSVGAVMGFRWVPARAGFPTNRPVEFTVLEPGDVRAELARSILTTQTMIQGRADDNFLYISLRGPDQFKIAATLDAVIRRFEEVAIQLKRERLTAQTAILGDQLRSAESTLAAHEAAFENFKIATATLPTETRGPGAPIPGGLSQTDNTLYGSYFLLNTQKDQLGRDRESIREALSQYSDGFGLVSALEVIPSIKTSTELTQVLREAAGSEADLRALLTTLTEEHPQVKSKIAYRDSLVRSVIPRMTNQLVADLQRREAELDAQLASLSTEMRRIPVRTIEGEKLARQRDIAETMYKDLESRFQASRLAEVTTVADLSVVDWPRVPFTPIDDPRRNLFLVIIAGSVALGLGLAVLRDRLDPRIQYPDQVTAGMGLNILGAVPALRGGRLGSGDMALAVEAFRSIQLSLTHAVANGGPIAVTFSSPGASDGKSFVASNLAIAFADMGHRTLVIDGDVRRGSMHKLLGAHHKPGLTDYLSGRTDRTAMIQETRYPLLHFIGCGSRQNTGPKLLGSPMMRALMRDLRADYDVIIVDSPPLGACVDPMILATLTRNLVLVVRSGSTDRILAESKLDALDRLPVRVVGAVLNDVSQHGPYRYYSYVSGYEVIEDDAHGLLTEAERAAGAGPEREGAVEAGAQATAAVSDSDERAGE